MPKEPTAASQIPRWPKSSAILNDDGTGCLTINDKPEDLTADNVDSARQIVLERVTATALELGRPVRLTSTDPDGVWELAVHPDGTAQELAAHPTTKTRPSPPRKTRPSPPRPLRSPQQASRNRPARPSGAPRLAAGLALAATILTSALVVINTDAHKVTAPTPAPTSTTPDVSQRAAGAALSNARRTATRRDALARQRRERSKQRRRARTRTARAASRRAAARRANARPATQASRRPIAPAPRVRVAPTPPPPPPPAPAACGDFDLC